MQKWMCFFFLLNTPLFAQKSGYYDTSFVATNHNKLLICPGVSIPLYSVSVKENNVSFFPQSALLVTTSPLLVGGHVTYRNLSFQLFFSAVNQLQNSSYKNHSNIFGLFTRVSFGKLGIEAQIRSLKGFYDLNDPIPSDEFSYRNYPKTGLVYIKLKGMYIFSKKLSYAAVFTGNEIQKKSACLLF
jgi:hypothetical protein